MKDQRTFPTTGKPYVVHPLIGEVSLVTVRESHFIESNKQIIRRKGTVTFGKLTSLGHVPGLARILGASKEFLFLWETSGFRLSENITVVIFHIDGAQLESSLKSQLRFEAYRLGLFISSNHWKSSCFLLVFAPRKNSSH